MNVEKGMVYRRWLARDEEQRKLKKELNEKYNLK
jgi:hypothetical protein